MDPTIRNHILFWSFATSGILFLLCILASLFYASLTKKYYCRLCSMGFLMIMVGIMFFSPERDQSARPLVAVSSLEPGPYALDDVWQVGKVMCALIRPVSITRTNVEGHSTISHAFLSKNWTLCDVTGTEVIGYMFPFKENPFTGYVMVEMTNNAAHIRMYDPLK